MDTPGVGLPELLRDLAIAWRNLAAYPPGHPLRTQSLEAALRQLQGLVSSGDALTLGVLRDGLMAGEEKLTGTAAQRLGETLHRRHVGLITLGGDLSARDLEVFLKLLGVDPRRVTGALWDELEAAGVRNVTLRPLDYEGVTLDENAATAGEAAPLVPPLSLSETLVRELLAGRESMAFGIDPATASLEEILALIGALYAESEREEAPGGGGGAAPAGGPGRAAGAGPEGLAPTGAGAASGSGLASGSGIVPGPGAGEQPADGGAGELQGGAPAATPGPGGSGALARGSRSARLSARLAQIVELYFARSHGAARAAAASDLADLTPRLPPGPRAALIEAAVRAFGVAATSPSEDERDDPAALEAFTRRLPSAEVLAALRRVAVSGTRLSARALRLAQALEQAAAESEPSDAQASAKALAELELLFADEDVDRVAPALPEPDSVEPLELPRAREIPAAELPELGPRLDTLTAAYVNPQLLAALLEMVAGKSGREISPAVLTRLEDTYRELLQAGRFTAALQVVAALQLARAADSADDTTDDLRRLLERLGNRESIRAMLGALRDLSDDAIGDVARLIERLGSPALRHLLGLLSEEQERSLRHRILGVLTALGAAIVPEATMLLQDSRWFVVRNMIVLLRTVNDQTSLPVLRRLADHGDLRVRLEAIKSLLASDSALPAELLARAIHDPDAKLAEAAIGLAGSYGIAQAVPPLLELLARPDRLARRRSVRLRALRTLSVLGDPQALPELDRIFLRERWFGRPAEEERLAAFRALAGFPDSERKPYVERGQKSRSAAVRATCRALAEGRLRAPEREAEDAT